MKKRKSTIACPYCAKQISPASLMAQLRVKKLSKETRTKIAKHANSHRKANINKGKNG